MTQNHFESNDGQDASLEKEENSNLSSKNALSRSKELQKKRREQAKKMRAAFLSRPEVQERLEQRKKKAREMARERRQRIAKAVKEKRNETRTSEKNAAKIQAKELLKQKQAIRDEELLAKVRPALTLIVGGKSNN